VARPPLAPYSSAQRQRGKELRQAVEVVGYVNLVVFTVLAVVAIGQWTRRRDRAAGWAALGFGALGAVVVAGQALPDHPHGVGGYLAQRLVIAVLVVFPYLLYRFTTAFRPPSRRLALAVGSMTSLLVVWTFALPHFPEAGEGRSRGVWAYLVAFVVHWSVLSIVVAWRLWHAGRRQPTVARRRMQLLALAATSLTLAIVLSAADRDQQAAFALASGLVALGSGTAFLLGLVPPAFIRMLWRRPEQDRVQGAIADLMTLATSAEEIAGRMLEPAAAIVGASAIALRDDDGRVIGAHNVPEQRRVELADGGVDGREVDDGTVIEIAIPSGSLLVWTTPYAPYFGSEELALLRTLGALTGLALDRVRLFAQEREARLALERANEVKTNFVALAAHELRTPVTTIYGFAETLDRLGERLGEARLRELREGLARETLRLARLVEQLLDLSRLDADAIEIVPQRVDIRARLEELVASTAPNERQAVRLEVPPGLEASVDPNAFERILSNLVTNALRYGRPPVIVRAERSDRHFRVAVEDRGPGIAPEFVPDLFERFTRSEHTRERTRGTGLGLAIARSYARAHDGDLLYHDADPHGARFELVLPTQPRRREL
jgi:signal transduction histidine kinase